MNIEYYDDNFGHWHMDDPETLAFYHNVQKRSVKKKCQRCGRMVKILPQYAICNSCAEKIEKGLDV